MIRKAKYSLSSPAEHSNPVGKQILLKKANVVNSGTHGQTDIPTSANKPVTSCFLEEPKLGCSHKLTKPTIETRYPVRAIGRFRIESSDQ